MLYILTSTRKIKKTIFDHTLLRKPLLSENCFMNSAYTGESLTLLPR